jgi:hypothetical protein
MQVSVENAILCDELDESPLSAQHTTLVFKCDFCFSARANSCACYRGFNRVIRQPDPPATIVIRSSMRVLNVKLICHNRSAYETYANIEDVIKT